MSVEPSRSSWEYLETFVLWKIKRAIPSLTANLWSSKIWLKNHSAGYLSILRKSNSLNSLDIERLNFIIHLLQYLLFLPSKQDGVKNRKKISCAKVPLYLTRTILFSKQDGSLERMEKSCEVMARPILSEVRFHFAKPFPLTHYSNSETIVFRGCLPIRQ